MKIIPTIIALSVTIAAPYLLDGFWLGAVLTVVAVLWFLWLWSEVVRIP